MENQEIFRERMRQMHLASDASVLDALAVQAPVSAPQRAHIEARGTALVESIRNAGAIGMMEAFLAEYSLSSAEGLALMSLAEATLRVPDARTLDALISDKIASGDWRGHFAKADGFVVNAATVGLMASRGMLGAKSDLGKGVKSAGHSFIRAGVKAAMKAMGHQFVLGRTVKEALKRGRKSSDAGYTFSFDMLGEAALTGVDARKFFLSYEQAISELKAECSSSDIRENPGVSIKLSALHPRYEWTQKARVMEELVPWVTTLARQAKAAGMGLNIDAEEADRLELSLDVIEAVLSDPELAGWDGLGVVVQAYGKRAAPVLDWLYALSIRLDRKIMVRLVKGAYWDMEIKRAQEQGLAGFPVFARKAASDVSYIHCAAKLLAMTDRIYPQFATHNAHTVAAVLELAQESQPFEFQRLHGMGETLHELVHSKEGTRCRIYAPVGAHRELLAYLVRRLLENGANSSFVSQITDHSVPAAVIAADPFAEMARGADTGIRAPRDLFAPERPNSRGWDAQCQSDLAVIDAARAPFRQHLWASGPLLACPVKGGNAKPVINPAEMQDTVGHVVEATAQDVENALNAATDWGFETAAARAAVLRRAADLYEENFGELFAVFCREAGKTLNDAVAELREAVDFLRYYAAQVEGQQMAAPLGLVACISPWNFPLAIFTGQIAAALAAGNGVLAKPAEPTTLTAAVAVRLLYAAGVPRSVLQLLPGPGPVVGGALSSEARISGVCFTGSTQTAQTVNRAMARSGDPAAPLVAETGGINAMIVDATALPEQVVGDVVASAFQSAGQRCSALRVLYLQSDVAPTILEMLHGAMDQLKIGAPWDPATDIGPVIDATAARSIQSHVDKARADGRLLKQLAAPAGGHFVGPAVLKVDGVMDVEQEVFGPVLHVATFEAGEADKVVADINASGYGLTFGLHSRNGTLTRDIQNKVNVGNVYINRNQIGAIVGSQPFGGEGLSGTGPKAGGPHYVARFTQRAPVGHDVVAGAAIGAQQVQAVIDALPVRDRVALHSEILPGPDGELNQLSVFARGVVLCLGPTREDAEAQAGAANRSGCDVVIVAPGARGPNALNGVLDRRALVDLSGIDVVALWSGTEDLRAARIALAQRTGALIPLVADRDIGAACLLERHVCTDTTAIGGNVALLSAS